MSTLKEPRISPVYYLGRNPQLIDRIAERLSDRGVQILGFDDLTELAVAITPLRCPVLLLEIEMVPANQTLSSLVRYLEMLFRAKPSLVCIAPTEDPRQRLAALRARAVAYFTPPLELGQVAEKLAQISGAPSKTRYCVLVVDDDPNEALEAERILVQDNMQIRRVEDPMSVLDALADFKPDLIVMDLYLPDVSGIELTTIIREHEAYFGIPIVFVSGEVIAEKQAGALSVGDDRFVAKPLEARTLVTAAHTCIERSQRHWHQTETATNTDRTTGFYNRAYFIKRLESTFSEHTEESARIAVLLIEVDHLEALIERIGQASADRLIGDLGGRLQQGLPKGDLIARYEAARFAVIAARDDPNAFTEASQQLVEAIRKISFEPATQGIDISISISIGIGLMRPPPDDALTLISRAETACAAAIKAGGGCVKVHEPFVPRTRQVDEKTQLTDLLEKALANDSFQLTYQPILNLRQQNDAQYETLLRLRSPDGELIPPRDFLPTAEHSRLIASIDRWVMTHSCAVLQDENQQGNRLRFFIHHSAATMAADDWVDWMRRQIIDHDLVHLRPVLQLRLTDIAEHRELMQQRLQQLQKLGMEICVTDFEESPEALGIVKDLPVSIIKLAPKSVSDLGAKKLKQLTLQLHAMNRQVIAPGIENPQTIGDVWSAGIDFIQGNFIQSPQQTLSFDFSESLLA